MSFSCKLHQQHQRVKLSPVQNIGQPHLLPAQPKNVLKLPKLGIQNIYFVKRYIVGKPMERRFQKVQKRFDPPHSFYAPLNSFPWDRNELK